MADIKASCVLIILEQKLVEPMFAFLVEIPGVLELQQSSSETCQDGNPGQDVL